MACADVRIHTRASQVHNQEVTSEALTIDFGAQCMSTGRCCALWPCKEKTCHAVLCYAVLCHEVVVGVLPTQASTSQGFGYLVVRIV